MKSHLKSQRTKPTKTVSRYTDSTPLPDSDELENLILGLLADASVHCVKYHVTDYIHDCMTVKSRMKSEGIGFATMTLPKLATGLFNYLETGSATYTGFKLQPGEEYPRFLKGMFYVVYHSSNAQWVTDAIKCIYQISVCCKKVAGPFERKKVAKQYRDFVEVDGGLSTIFDGLDDEDFETLQLCRHYIRNTFRGVDYDSARLRPRPGPGATRTKTPNNMRYVPHVMYESHQQCFPYDEWFYSHPWDVVDEARSFLELIKNKKRMPLARVKYVPKIYGKGRGICVEENESQYLQQALSACLRACIAATWLKGHILFTDQSVNANLALKASVDCEDATIDMSEASDRIPRDLVSWGFQDNEWLHNALMSLSTRFADSPSEVDVYGCMLNKYAAMGSGLCFPVMGIMHYFLIKAIVMRAHHIDIGDQLYVYGDDIVLPSKYAQCVFDRLPKYGMKLNRTKSFVESHFRESCGVHAYLGRDITPVFLRKTYNTGTPDALASHFATENLLFSKGYFHSAKCLRDRVEKTGLTLPFVPTWSPVVGWKRPARLIDDLDLSKTGYIAKSRWDVDHQCYEYRVRILKGIKEPNTNCSENQGLLRWYNQNTEDSVVFQGQPKKFKFAWAWKLASACH